MPWALKVAVVEEFPLVGFTDTDHPSLAGNPAPYDTLHVPPLGAPLVDRV